MPTLLTDPAPPRAWSRTPSGGWIDHPYSEADVLRTLAGGARFDLSRTEFESRAVAVFAGQAQGVWEELAK